MRHLAAYILLVVGGNESPSAEDVTTLLGTAGIEVDESRLTSLLADLEGKSLDELIKLGREQLCSMGGGGGAAPAAAAPAAGGSGNTNPRIMFFILN